MMGWTTQLRRKPSFETYEQEGLGRGKGMAFTEDGHDKEILQLELYKLLSCLEEMMERGWLEPDQLLKWILRHHEGLKVKKWREPTEKEAGKWGEPEWEGKKKRKVGRAEGREVG